MSRSVFGWSYPPGAASDPYAPYNQVDPPCELCGLDPSECECPECAGCGIVGVPLAENQRCADCNTPLDGPVGVNEFPGG